MMYTIEEKEQEMRKCTTAEMLKLYSKQLVQFLEKTLISLEKKWYQKGLHFVLFLMKVNKYRKNIENHLFLRVFFILSLFFFDLLLTWSLFFYLEGVYLRNVVWF